MAAFYERALAQTLSRLCARGPRASPLVFQPRSAVGSCGAVRRVTNKLARNFAQSEPCWSRVGEGRRSPCSGEIDPTSQCAGRLAFVSASWRGASARLEKLIEHPSQAIRIVDADYSYMLRSGPADLVNFEGGRISTRWEEARVAIHPTRRY